MHKVSVVMPVFNTEQFVGEAIQSILDQTFTDFELIIIDDGSTDRSRTIIQEYVKKDERVRAYQNSKNKGIAYTRQKLIDLTTTNYIASMDSDDISLPERLHLCYNFLLTHPDYAVVSGDNIIIDQSGSEIGYRKYSNTIRAVILKKSPISQGSSMFKKNLYRKVGGYDSGLNYGEDYDLWCKLYAGGYKLKNSNSYLLKVRIRTGQTKTANLKNTLKNTIKIQKKAHKKYGIPALWSDKLYWFGESILLLLPASRIMFLFQLIEYRGVKN